MATLNDGRVSVDVSANKTLTAADQGIIQNVIVDGVTVTVPAAGAAATGSVFIVRNGGDAPSGAPTGAGADGSAGVTVAPTGTDTVSGNGFTAAAGKGAVNTKATAKVGDEVVLVSGVNNYNLAEIKGTWARVA